jgi:hypothetical protein
MRAVEIVGQDGHIEKRIIYWADRTWDSHSGASTIPHTGHRA